MVPEVWEITAPKLRPKELRQNSKRAYSRGGGHAKLRQAGEQWMGAGGARAALEAPLRKRLWSDRRGYSCGAA